LAAFSQFASDLDTATRKQLERGARLMEVIKQGVNEPLPVANQVAIIFAGTGGYLDDLPVAQVRAFEKHLHESLSSRHVEFVRLFQKVQAMNDEVKSALDKVLKEVKVSFAQSQKKG
jgi:F-type H+-transporting ATPase subunit alpha